LYFKVEVDEKGPIVPVLGNDDPKIVNGFVTKKNFFLTKETKLPLRGLFLVNLTYLVTYV
jgi:hypothetical protein